MFYLMAFSAHLTLLERALSIDFLSVCMSRRVDVTVVEDVPKYRLPVPFFHFCRKLTHPAARSLCDS